MYKINLQFLVDIDRETIYRLITLHLISQRSIVGGAIPNANIVISDTDYINQFQFECADEASLFFLGSALTSLPKRFC